MNQLIRTWIHRYFSNPQMAILWLLLIVGFALVLLLGEMLAPVLAAIVIAYLLEGVNSLLIKRRVPRTAAVLIVFIFFMVSFLALLIVLLPLISRQIGQLVQQLPAMFAKGQHLLLQLPEKYHRFSEQSDHGLCPEYPVIFTGFGARGHSGDHLSDSGAADGVFLFDGQAGHYRLGEVFPAGQSRTGAGSLAGGQPAVRQLRARQNSGNHHCRQHQLCRF
jgi:hypothetical protein